MRIRKETELLPEEDVLLIAGASDALAHPARVEIFRYIYTQNMKRSLVCTKDLVAEFDYSQATVSQHMKKLLISGLVTAEKKGTYSYYFVNLGMLARFLGAVKKLNS
jgi:DNA-binding transcriptional ArsR family regulator